MPAKLASRPPLRALAPLLLALAAACSSTPHVKPQWSTGQVNVPSERILWEVTMLALEKQEFPVGSRIDPVALEAVTGWRNHLAPFRGEGYRERAHVKYRHTGGGTYEVDVRVEREANMDISRPLDARYAKWEPSPDDSQKAGILLQRIKAYVGGEIEVNPAEPLPWESGS